jgi:hypothetical protein
MPETWCRSAAHANHKTQISNPKELSMVASGKNHAGVEILIFGLLAFGRWRL